MDLIDRQAAIEALKAHRVKTAEMMDDCGFLDGIDKSMEIVQKLPSARKTGKWKRTFLDHEAIGERPSILYCSVCNQCIACPTNFCPNCGADMRGEE